jgi:uncharacterized UBP type Zn finger protein
MTELVSERRFGKGDEADIFVQQLEHNLKFDFSMTGEDGKELEPVFGKGMTGLENLGNRWVLSPTLHLAF